MWIPSIVLLCVLGFTLLHFLPGDPVLARMHAAGVKTSTDIALQYSPEYQNFRSEMGLDLPPFYCSIRPGSVPEWVYEIPHPNHQKTLHQMCLRYSDQMAVRQWYTSNIQLLTYAAQKQFDDLTRGAHMVLNIEDNEKRQQTQKWLLERTLDQESAFLAKTALEAHTTIILSGWQAKSYLPNFMWHGNENQFHQWLFGFQGNDGLLHGNLGTSLRNSQPVSSIVWPAFKTTLTLSAVAIFLIYFVSIPLGLRLSRFQTESRLHTLITIIFAIYAMPGFWLGILLLVFFCSPDFLNWFPVAYSLMDIPADANFVERLLTAVYYLILPVTCWSLSGIAFLTLQTLRRARGMRFAPFAISARAKGLTEKEITARHIRRLAALPAISMMGSIIPAALSGAIAVEVIFSISGMGQLIFNSFHSRDFPVIMAILLIVGTIAMLATALADIAQHLQDPRLHKSSAHAI